MNFGDKVFAIAMFVGLVGLLIVMPLYMFHGEHEEKMACIQNPTSPICKKFEAQNLEICGDRSPK
jgi:hypothetical protein